MIVIDTNILLRLWLNDDPAQNKRIDTLLDPHGGNPGSLLVTDIVLVEAASTLKSVFEQDKHAQLIAVRSLLEETPFAFEDRESVAATLTVFEAAPLRMRRLPGRCHACAAGLRLHGHLRSGHAQAAGGQGALT